MQDRQLYQQILGIGSPWLVSRVELDLEAEEVHVYLGHAETATWCCPECGEVCPLQDHQPERTWRHLDTCQYQTLLHAELPRTRCEAHGVRVVQIPWAEPYGRFTALFERLVIDWLQAASQQAVADRVGLSWDEVHGIMERAVKRGLTRREAEPIPHIGVDEKSFRKRHRYVTVVSDIDRGRVLYVAEDRKQKSLDGFWPTLSKKQLASIKGVAMDMWEPYVNSTEEHLPNAEEKIVFDKFHVAKHLGEAVDKVRRTEHKELRAEGDERLKGTKYDWLKGRDKFEAERLASLLPPSPQQPEDVSGMGDARTGDEALGLQLPRRCGEPFPLVVSLGNPQPPETDDRESEDAENPPEEHPHVSDPPDYKRSKRKPELEDPMGQVHRTRLPQPRQLQNRHLLPLRRPRPATSHLDPSRAHILIGNCNV